MKTLTRTILNDLISNPNGHDPKGLNVRMTTWETDIKKRTGSEITFLIKKDFNNHVEPGTIISTRPKTETTTKKVKNQVMPDGSITRFYGWEILDVLNQKESTTLIDHTQFKCLANYILIKEIAEQ